MQVITYGITIPIFLLVHLSTSPTVTSRQVRDYLVDLPDILSVLPAMIVGFAVPTVLMALPAPSILTFYQKQVFLAIWQCYPVWVGILHQIFSFAINAVGKKDLKHHDQQEVSMRATRVLYAILILNGAVSQLSTFQFGATVNLFPGLFAPEFQSTWNFRGVFIPKSITAATKVDSIGSGSHLLLQYDELVGDVSMSLWAFTLFIQAQASTIRPLQIVRYVIIGYLVAALAGSLGFVVAAIWARDELIFAKPSKEGKKE